MNHVTPTKRGLSYAFATLAAVPFAVAWGSSSAAAAKASRTQTFAGPTVYANHGPVAVKIVTRNRKIVSVVVRNASEQGRSLFIQEQAIPVLKQEILRAQSARINEVSGATDTSGGYITSLQYAVKKARHAKALR